MSKIIIKNAVLVNEGKSFVSDVLINLGKIELISENIEVSNDVEKVIDATGLHLLPGAIDDQVHFREPGLTHKANIHSES